MNASELATRVNTREDFVAFVGVLVSELRSDPDAWENNRLDAYLAAMAAWTEDMEGYFVNRGGEVPREPTWQLLATILMGATMYE